MKNCCCKWGAAISDEFPEFSCACCEIHADDEWLGGEYAYAYASLWKCKRHTKESVLLQKATRNWQRMPVKERV